jgi:tRNA-specific 2-thiouridylase
LAPHEGIHRFTVGQRRNLGVATGERAYVTDIDVDSATVRLGRNDELLSQQGLLDDVVLHPGVALPLECDVAVRYRGVAHPATVDRDGSRFRVRFRTPVSAVVPGQVAVFYRGDVVLGGGTLSTPESASPRRLPLMGASPS